MLSMVVIGCKQSVDSGNPNWTTDEKTKKVWEQDNSSDKYVRAFKQFGTSFSVTGTSSPIVAKLEVADLTTSKAGLVFGFNKYTENTYQYFVLGVGGKDYNTETGDYYISYYYDVNINTLDEANSNQNAPGNAVHISGTTNKDINSGAMNIVGTSGTVYVSVKEAQTSSDKKTITVEIGKAYDGKTKQISGVKTTETFEIGKGASNPSANDTQKRLENVSSINGGIGAYGMIKSSSNGFSPFLNCCVVESCKLKSTNRQWVLVPF